MLNQARLFYCPADMILEERYPPCGSRPLERDDFSSNHHPALSYWLVARPDGKPVSTFPGRALAGVRRHQAMGDDLAQDAPLDRPVRRGRIGPPPSVLLHRLGG